MMEAYHSYKMEQRYDKTCLKLKFCGFVLASRDASGLANNPLTFLSLQSRSCSLGTFIVMFKPL